MKQVIILFILIISLCTFIYGKINNKQKIKELEQKINDQTTGKNSKKWEEFKWLFVAGGVGLIFLILQSLIKVVIK